MPTISEFAKSYEPKKTKNISELSEVPTDLQLDDDEFMGKDFETGEAKMVKQKIVTLNGEQYRVPFSVITDLQAILKQNPALKKFSVSKKGTGKGTKYTVIPLA